MRRLSLPAVCLLVAGCYEEGAPRRVYPATEALTQLERAYAALQKGQPALAKAHAKRAYEADRAFQDAAWLYAGLLGREGNYDGALAVCDQMLAQHPDYVPGYLLKGILWELSGKQERAMEAYDRVLEALSEPHNRFAGTVCGTLASYLHGGKLRGVQYANQMLERFPDDPMLTYMKRCMQEKDRAFLLRWFTEGAKEESAKNQDKVDNTSNTGATAGVDR